MLHPNQPTREVFLMVCDAQNVFQSNKLSLNTDLKGQQIIEQALSKDEYFGNSNRYSLFYSILFMLYGHC